MIILALWVGGRANVWNSGQAKVGQCLESDWDKTWDIGKSSITGTVETLIC